MVSNETAKTSVPRIISVEDNPADVRLVEEGIKASGVELELEVIHSGGRAIEQFQTIDSDAVTAQPDLVLLDLNLPDRSGFDVLETIRTETDFQDVPVVVISSSNSNDDIRRVYELSANAYVTKPVDPDEYIQMLQATVNFWIRRSSNT
jgi:CheY-like chemotaxis protein